MNEIKETQTTLNNIGNDEDILKEKFEETFLSSKGMLRSAKKTY